MSRSASALDIVIFGLAITSAWGNGHATTYRALTRALAERGHRVRFFERDLPWYADNRDLPHPPYALTTLYSSPGELERHFPHGIDADAVILGSYVPDGARLAEWILTRARGLVAFYDIDTPVTVSRLDHGTCEYLSPALVPAFDLYLSFAGGPILGVLQQRFGARRARPLYCSVDPQGYFPEPRQCRYDLGYLGTYSADRQPTLARLLVGPARGWPSGRFCVAGPQYPPSTAWPANVARIEHLGPERHRRFYNEQRCTLNVTRAAMVENGYSPSVRLFEAAACGVPIISDRWRGLAEFFTPGREILVADSGTEVLHCLRALDASELRRIGRRARERVLAEHTAAHRAAELESYLAEAAQRAVSPASAARWDGTAILSVDTMN